MGRETPVTEERPAEKRKERKPTLRETLVAGLPGAIALGVFGAASHGMISWWWLIIPAGAAFALAMMADEEFARGVFGLLVLAALGFVAFAVLKWSAGVVFG